jgi:alanyl-tRNA synthetase
VLIDEYEKLYAESRAAARAARKDAGAEAWKGGSASLKDIEKTEFLGYTQNECDAEIKAIIIDGERAEVIEGDTQAAIVLDRTVF